MSQENSLIIIFNDAKSCYDRVVHWVAALALRRLGASKESTLGMMNPYNTHIMTFVLHMVFQRQDTADDNHSLLARVRSRQRSGPCHLGGG